MEFSILMEYGWVLLVLIMLEGILAADNALVLAIMVKDLPGKQRQKALFYGLAGAFVLRFASLFVISFLVDVWQVQAIGAMYLLFLAGNHVIRKVWIKKEESKEDQLDEKKGKTPSFWGTVAKVELADVAFAVDSILAAVALAVTLPNTPIRNIGGMDGGQFLVILTGGLIGVVIMRFAASAFVRLLHRRPGLETAAFLIVGWVGIKLVVHTLSHPSIGVIGHSFAESTAWKVSFYIVLVLIAVGGWFLSSTNEYVEETAEELEEKTQQVKSL